MVEESVIDKIKEHGYWKVIIRPLKYDKEKKLSLNTLKETIPKCEVSFRGWPYPIIKEVYSGKDYIWGGVDWQNHIEYWRFYQSLQFYHMFSMREDWDENVENIFGGKKEKPRKPGAGFSVFSSLYTFAEIFEFTNRLVKNVSIENGVQIKIELVGTNGRQLFCYNPTRNMALGDYVSTMDSIPFERKMSTNEILKDSTKLALECCNYFFERFNWTGIPLDNLRTEIYKYVSKKPPEQI